MWSPRASADLVVDPIMEAAAIIPSRISQPLEGARLRVIYLAEKVCCQLAGEDAPQISIGPLVFMLASLSIMNAEYDLWGLSIPYTK